MDGLTALAESTVLLLSDTSNCMHCAYKAHSALATQHSATTVHQAALRSLHAHYAKQSTHYTSNRTQC
eukprot:16877-Heterococcus_DN1.PRE.2